MKKSIVQIPNNVASRCLTPINNYLKRATDKYSEVFLTDDDGNTVIPCKSKNSTDTTKSIFEDGNACLTFRKDYKIMAPVVKELFKENFGSLISASSVDGDHLFFKVNYGILLNMVDPKDLFMNKCDEYLQEMRDYIATLKDIYYSHNDNPIQLEKEIGEFIDYVDECLDSTDGKVLNYK